MRRADGAAARRREASSKPLLERLADSVGRAAGFVGGLVLGERGPPPERHAPVGRRQELREEIVRIEDELGRLHARITSGAHGEAAGSPEAWIQRARELRAAVHERRLELIRVERRIAREKRLWPEHPREARGAEGPAPTGDDRHRSRRNAMQKILSRHDPKATEERRSLRRAADALFDADPEVRRRGVARLAEMDLAACAPLLCVAVEDESDRVRLTALHALLERDRAAPPVLLLRLVDDPAPLVRAAALFGLARTRQRAAAPLAAKALEDAAAEVRRGAVEVLGRCPASEAVPLLGFALGDDDMSVRLAAADALGVLADDRAVLSLIRVLDDDSERVREAAARSLKAIVGEAVEEAARQLEPGDVVPGLVRWWLAARVQLVVARTLRAAGVSLDESSVADLLRPGSPPPRPTAEAPEERAPSVRPAARVASAARVPAPPAPAPSAPAAPRAPAAPASSAVEAPRAEPKGARTAGAAPVLAEEQTEEPTFAEEEEEEATESILAEAESEMPRLAETQDEEPSFAEASDEEAAPLAPELAASVAKGDAEPPSTEKKAVTAEAPAEQSSDFESAFEGAGAGEGGFESAFEEGGAAEEGFEGLGLGLDEEEGGVESLFEEPEGDDEGDDEEYETLS